jgi:hypothetical protein
MADERFLYILQKTWIETGITFNWKTQNH